MAISMPSLLSSATKRILLIASLFIFSHAPAPAVEVQPGIPYNIEDNLLLDLYLPDGWRPTDNRPAAILIHGGGWSSGDRSEFAPLAQWLAAQGAIAIAVDYRLAPDHKWPAQGIDVAQGVWWLRNNVGTYGINPGKIVSIGGSAGGQLAAMLAQTALFDPRTGVSSQVQAVVSMWGPWNLTNPDPGNSEQLGILSNLLASTADAYGASPIFLISGSSPPALLFHGTADGLVPYQQSVDACAAYANAQAPYCQLVSLEGQGHTFPTDVNLVLNPLLTFLSTWVSYPQ